MTNGKSGLFFSAYRTHALTLDSVVILGLLMARLQGCIKCGIRIGPVANTTDLEPAVSQEHLS